MKTAEKLGFGISSFDFMLTPLQISEMGKPSKIGSGEQYIVELEKGAQLIKRFTAKVEFNRNREFYFTEAETIALKIYNAKSSHFSVLLIRQQDESQTFVSSFQLQILQAFENYSGELANNFKDYAEILQKIQQKEQIGGMWKRFKQNCSQHHQKLTSKTADGTFELAYLVEIRSYIDILAESEESKRKLKPKQSHESQRHSNSSINSKSKKNQQNSVSTIEKSLNVCSSGLTLNLGQSSLKEEPSSRTQSLKDFSRATSTQNIHIKEETLLQPIELPQTSSISQKEVYFIPIQSVVRKNEILSDIVQASYEGDSLMNSGGDKTDRRWREMPEIKEEDQTILFKRKTYHFLNKQEDFVQIRRINSLHNLSKQGGQNIESDTRQYVEDQHLYDEQFQEVTTKKNVLKSVNRLEKTTLLVLLLFCCLFGICSFQLLPKTRQPIKKIASRNSKRARVEKVEKRGTKLIKRHIF